LQDVHKLPLFYGIFFSLILLSINISTIIVAKKDLGTIVINKKQSNNNESPIHVQLEPRNHLSRD